MVGIPFPDIDASITRLDGNQNAQNGTETKHRQSVALLTAGDNADQTGIWSAFQT